VLNVLEVLVYNSILLPYSVFRALRGWILDITIAKQLNNNNNEISSGHSENVQTLPQHLTQIIKIY